MISLASFTQDRIIFMVLGFVAHEVPFILYQLVCGWFRQKGYFKQYLIQPDFKYPPEDLVRKAIRQLFIGHGVAQWVVLYFVYDIFVWRGFEPLSQPINWFQLFYFFPFMIICDTALYWSHRTLHHPALYARFHKQHHEFHVNIALASEYFSIVEEFTAGFFPTLLGPFIFAPHTAIVLLWIAFRVCESSDAHCGYDFPFSIFSLGRPGDRHDFHHSHNKGNYSAFFTFWDEICGTDQHYKAHLLKKNKAKAE